jgi:hypothetical protein
MALTFPPGPTPGQQYFAPNGITYTWDNSLGVWVGGSAASTPLAATLAEAAAGVLDTVFLSPKTGVPKDASGMTGAAILPSGTNTQRAAITGLTAGMTRFNTDYTPESLEVYDGANWNQLAYVPSLGTLPDLTPANGSTLPAAGTYENIIINAGVTVNVPSTCSLSARTSIQINGTVNANSVGNYGGSNVGVNSNESRIGLTGQGLGIGTSVYGFASSFVGSGGGSSAVSAGSATSTAGGGGGRSGGTVVFKCSGPITLGASAIIQAAGQDGSLGTSSGANYGVSGSGGGSGGLIILQSDTSLALATGSQLFVNGGNGANAQVTGTITGAGGGGGGGGGYIVLNSPSTTDSSTKTLTGGAGGATVSTGAGLGGAGGAGFGGAGGAGSSSAANGVAGSVGQVILNAFI